MAYTQTNRRIAISTPLGPDALLLRGFTGSEAISHPFQFELDLLSENDSIKFQDIVGKNVTIRLFDDQGAERHWNGFLTRFSQGSQSDRLTEYRARMEPWLWFLTRKADCRIFQNVAVPEIIRQIFVELGFQDFEFRLYGQFEPRDYCVQYRETDFNFVSRLMEEEGICYFFRHGDGKHTLILANDQAAHDPCDVQSVARYDTRPGALAYEDTITGWSSQEEFRTGGWSQTDYNFETPGASLAVTVNGRNRYEYYDYPGEYMVRGQGDRLARIRLQEQVADAVACHGEGGCRYFTAGFRFTLQDHYRADQNQEYLLTAIHHAATQGGSYEVSSNGEDLTYHNSFECVPSSTPFRPARVTPQPVVHGCQTALVVGPAGEEIYTDKYGRVKVQFHWDRQGKKNANSSCWMRVSYPWAGQQWGSISIPRIGQEVVVGFLEGDPDQPIIVGRVYNAEQMPPWALPANATQSGLLTRSSKGGSAANANALRFEDKKGSEQVWFHAEKDMATEVEHDKTLWVGHDEACVVDHDRTRVVKHDEAITIQNDRRMEVDRDKSEKVLRDKSINVIRNHHEKIDGSMDIMVGRTLTESVAINYSETVGGAMEITVGGLIAITAGAALAETVGAQRAEMVGGASSESVGGNKSIDVGKDLSETVAGNHIADITGDHKETVGGQYTLSVTKELSIHAKKIELVADDEIAIKTGSAQIVMKKNGDIAIEGAKLNIKGSGDIIIKGSQIKEN